jgi:hypothetical protein
VVLVDKLLLLLDALAVHLLQQLLAELDVGDEGVAPVLAEVLAHDDAEHLQLVGVWRHGVRRHHPSPGALFDVVS